MLTTEQPAVSQAQLLSLATEAYIWGFSTMLYAKYLRDFQKAAAPFNRFFAMDRMATPNHGGVNVDTLYGVAWLDVGEEPVVLHVPDAHDRYYSIQMVDVYANNFAYVGRRTTGTRMQRFIIVGPDWHSDAPPGLTLVRSPSRRVFCFLRTLIDDEDDVVVANEFHRELSIAPLSRFPQGLLGTVLLEDLAPYFPHAHSHLDKLGAPFFDYLGDALESDPPTRVHDIELMKRFAAIGVGPGLHPVPASAAVLAQAVERGHRTIFAKTTSIAVNGWSLSRNFDDDHKDPLIKAAINRRGLGMVGIEEAIYLMPTALGVPSETPVHSWESCGPDGEPLTGAKQYRLRFRSGQLPQVDAFWSLTLYDHDLMLVENPIGRYAIGDRTPGLAYGADGSLELLIQRERPAHGSANWLPAPEGVFQLFFRGYQPSRAFQTGEYQVPPLEIVG